MVKTLKKKRKNPLALVLLDEQFQGTIASGSTHRLFTSVHSKKLAVQKNVVIVSKASGLSGISEFIREINEKNHLKGLFIRPDVKTELLPKLMHESGVSTLKHTFILESSDALQRVVNAWNLGAPDALIADASARIGTTLELEITAHELADVAVPELADAPAKGPAVEPVPDLPQR